MTFQLKNPHLNENDYLYHIGVNAKDDLHSQYGDLKFVCTGGKAGRIENLAKEMYKLLDKPKNSILEDDDELRDIAKSSGRYCMFKVGEVLLVSHGIGMASLSVVLNEIFKLLYYAKCASDVKIIRVGSSGGLGVKPGTLIITDKPYNSSLKRKFEHVALGEKYKLPCAVSDGMRDDLLTYAKRLGIPAEVGNTMSSDCFFEGQGRLDGAFCDYNSEDKLRFLMKANREYGVKNMEMESPCFAALCNRAGLECAIVCPTLLNRLENNDTVLATAEQMGEWESQMFQVVCGYIVNALQQYK